MPGPLTYTVDGLVPRGMWISRSGTISGSPQQAGTFAVPLTVKDSRGGTAKLVLFVRVCGICAGR